MGAMAFYNVYRGDADMSTAFREVVENALWENGHGGYTGTIAEAPDVQLAPVDPKPAADAYAYARELLDSYDDRPRPEKWENAWAVPLLPQGWLFFGIASS